MLFQRFITVQIMLIMLYHYVDAAGRACNCKPLLHDITQECCQNLHGNFFRTQASDTPACKDFNVDQDTWKNCCNVGVQSVGYDCWDI